MKKGVRQGERGEARRPDGDPMAPYLFLIAAEGLSTAFKEAKLKGVFHGTKLPNGGPEISYL